MKLCIPVCVSFDCDIPDLFQHDPYVLVGCGGYHSNKVKFTDDVGDNISQWNQYINEGTLFYWMTKHYNNTLNDPDYIGFAHYRKHLIFEDKMLDVNNVICHAEDLKTSIYNHYCICHVKSDIDLFIQHFNKAFSTEKMKSFAYFLNQSFFCGWDLFIMHRDKFKDYSSFICKCIELLIEKVFPDTDIAQRDRYQKRALVFMLERLTAFWIYDQLMHNKSNVICVPKHEFDIKSPYSRV